MSAGSPVGTWTRRAGPACAARYPDRLSILPDGQYRGVAAKPGEFTYWDVGTWRLCGPGEIALSTANDAVVTYRYELGAGTLRFTDPDGCRFTYETADE